VRGCRRRPRICRPRTLKGHQDLTVLVRSFRRDHAPSGRIESRFFRQQRSIEQAIHHVALAIDEHGQCYDHQSRIRRIARIKAKGALLVSVDKLRASACFHELHTLLETVLLPVRGIGELYVYDASLRLGAHLGLNPTFVYLHASTRVGANALGVGHGRAYLEMHELPKALRGLTPDEVESFLCIYRHSFRRTAVAIEYSPRKSTSYGT
jgi:hypothetical protein